MPNGINLGAAMAYTNAFNDALVGTGVMGLLPELHPASPDLLAAAAFYKAVDGGSWGRAPSWTEGSSARMLFPGADMKEARIADCLAAVGAPGVFDKFFAGWLDILKKLPGGDALGAGGAAAKPAVKSPEAAAGAPEAGFERLPVFEDEPRSSVRRAYLADLKEGGVVMSSFYPKRFVDESDLAQFLDAAKKLGLGPDRAVLGGDYLTLENIGFIRESGAHFMASKVPAGLSPEDLDAPAVVGADNAAVSGNACYFVVRRPGELLGRPAWFYSCLDCAKLAGAFFGPPADPEVVQTARERAGFFNLVSSLDLPVGTVLRLRGIPAPGARERADLFDGPGLPAESLARAVEIARGQFFLSFLTSLMRDLLEAVHAARGLDFADARKKLAGFKCHEFFDNLTAGRPAPGGPVSAGRPY